MNTNPEYLKQIEKVCIFNAVLIWYSVLLVEFSNGSIGIIKLGMNQLKCFHNAMLGDDMKRLIKFHVDVYVSFSYDCRPNKLG